LLLLGRAVGDQRSTFVEFELLCDKARDALHHPLTRGTDSSSVTDQLSQGHWLIAPRIPPA
jgi:hypothetical protein